MISLITHGLSESKKPAEIRHNFSIGISNKDVSNLHEVYSHDKLKKN